MLFKEQRHLLLLYTCDSGPSAAAAALRSDIIKSCRKVAKTCTSNMSWVFISITLGEHFTALENFLPWISTIREIEKLH